ncbi:protein phosphatase [Pseudomonas sp. HMWF032]|uniref:PP2C family protein-serine/threonine phosphatase n=1 Tax=unclassified Pseudomonas TaxID=196821 RepID=UPI000D363772|nr:MULTISPECIES: PP2C family serine/threonine-protein phosphatase [unclassified Pseudomonas]PTS84840.1 protein phosphatase [Pseudomonas sp. HMWF032]PTT84388.1 protein phosphatase [Pseudomonas sp. HMWF010]WAC46285.1 serine/threonine-protein phosphatase [Pseudomonas sp. SL4(2022)]
MQEVANRWRSAARTDTGKVRARNEDAFLALPEQGLWVVADGMGGHQNGALASRLIVEQLAEPSAGDLPQRLDELRKRLHALNRRLGQELTVTAAHPDPVIGSTVVALLIEGDRAACVWAGDSRCYLWRGSRLYQLSRDHSLLQQLIDEQQLSPSEAARHPAAHALTRAIGASDELKLEILELDVLPGDAFLLCSDGLYQGVSVDDIGAALNLPSPQLTLNRLFQLALDGPARDNLSAVVIRR